MTALDYAGEGPLRDREMRELGGRRIAVAAVSLVAVLALEVTIFGLSLTPDLFILVGLAPALVLGRGRRYLLDFVPFFLLILLYTELRGVAHLAHAHPYYLPQLLSEERLFAGHVPTLVLQRWLWTGTPRWYDSAAAAVTHVHFFVPPLLALGLWLKDRSLFRRFAASYLSLSFIAAGLFLLLPSAPPWAAARAGLIAPAARLTSEKSLDHLPAHAGPLYRLLLSNPYAAIPSLHAGYAFLVFLSVARLGWRTRWRWPLAAGAALYPLVQGLAVVYTANHYVVDLLIGCLYAGAAYLAFSKSGPSGGLRQGGKRLLALGTAATACTAVLLAVGWGGSAGPNIGAALGRAALDPRSGYPAEVDLAALAPFAWTRVYVFGSDTTAAAIEGALGFRWRDTSFQLPGGASGLLVFVNGVRVVRELRFTSSEPRLDCISGRSFSRASARFHPETRLDPWLRQPATFLLAGPPGQKSAHAPACRLAPARPVQ